MNLSSGFSLHLRDRFVSSATGGLNNFETFGEHFARLLGARLLLCKKFSLIFSVFRYLQELTTYHCLAGVLNMFDPTFVVT